MDAEHLRLSGWNDVRGHINKPCDGKQWQSESFFSPQTNRTFNKISCDPWRMSIKSLLCTEDIVHVWLGSVAVMTLAVSTDSGLRCVCTTVIGRCLLELTGSSPAACLLCKLLPPDGLQLPGSPLPTASD